jgi:FtsZ-binding cell division protein ZapB
MDSSQATIAAQDTDALLHLEERILRAIDLVNSLRADKQGLLSERAKLISEKEALETELLNTQAEVEELQSQLAALREERKEVKGRIERLLGQMDSINVG